MLNKIARSLAVGVIGTFGLLSQAHAQIGSGWTPYSPPMTLQLRGCGAHNAAGGVETVPPDLRRPRRRQPGRAAEMNDYSSGTNQFEGEVRVVASGRTSS